MEFASKDLCTLQLGPLWVLSALTGTAARFRSYELDAFWDTVVAVTLRTPATARDILISIAQDRAQLLLEFELLNEPVVSGLRHVVAALDRGTADVAADYKLAVFRIGLGIGRSRGPYGRAITPGDEQLLLLIAELLELDVVPPIVDDVLV